MAEGQPVSKIERYSYKYQRRSLEKRIKLYKGKIAVKKHDIEIARAELATLEDVLTLINDDNESYEHNAT